MAKIKAFPCYPIDKVLFPAFVTHGDAQAWRESTTFYNDFKIAEMFDAEKNVKDTFKRAFENWKDNAKYICELCVVSNHLLWEHFNKGKETLARLYDGFYKKCYAHIFQADSNGENISPFTDDEIRMIYDVLD